ncbi:MAG: AAA family ATPase [Verrucomicrobia bacterium]|nr:AAA family ATPase [Verrucomicrobiota bacterium]
MSRAIVGRDEELKILQEIFESNEPQFLAIYGRRRIGKTYLIHEFFKNKGVYFEITGMKDGSTAEQLLQFAYEFSRQFNRGERMPPPKNWAEALHLLHRSIEKVEPTKKVILFFDEVPWLASRRSKFLNALEHFWNRYLSKQNNVILIICGSSASWLIRNIINNKGGLHGRVTRKIRLLPFTLSETEHYLNSRQIELDRKQIADLYMAMGGVPKYLSYVGKGKSAAQMINEICFTPNGGLYNEFDNLYKSLFENYERHISIVKALAKAPAGLTKEALLDKVKLASGGSSSRIIEELVDAGFLVYIPSLFKKKKSGVYRLIDEYSLFYFTWIAENSHIGLESSDPKFWIKKQGTPKWHAWSGCAFEALCLKHIPKIKQALGISGISTVETGWHYLPKASAQTGAQIDLVIDRADRCINLCEMKYSDFEFVIDKAYLENLRTKKRVFKEQTETKKTLFTTMVTTYGVKKNSHYHTAIDNQVTMDDLF